MDAAILGILAGVVGGVAIGFLTFFFGSRLFDEDTRLVWFWFIWAIGPVAGIFAGSIIGGLVHHAMSRRVEIAERNAPRAADLR